MRRLSTPGLSDEATTQIRAFVTAAAERLGEEADADFYADVSFRLLALARVSESVAIATVEDCAGAVEADPDDFSSMGVFIGMLSGLLRLSVETTMDVLFAAEEAARV